jgi:hypothetical protein
MIDRSVLLIVAWRVHIREQFKTLVKKWSAGEPEAVVEVEQRLHNAGWSIDSVMAEALMQNLDTIERIDRMIAAKEARRNATLREIDRRRAAFGASLRQSVETIDGEFRKVETSSSKALQVDKR